MFVHLHGHSTYSVLDGLCKIDDLIDKAVDNGMEALAITDHASISCLDEFYYKAKDKNIKPIIGAEFYVVNDKFTQEKKKKRYHLLVLAKNWDGILSINKMLTKANMYFNKRPLIDWDDALCFNNCVISTACSSGVLSHPDYNVLVESFYQTYKDDFYLEIMPFQVFYSEENDDKDVKDMQKIINEKAVDLHKKYGIKCICTNDYHFINREDYKSHEVLLAIQRKTTMNNPKRWKFDTDDVYFKTESEMLRACQEMGFSDDFIIEMFLNIQEIVNKCNVEIPKFEFDLPSPYDGDDEEILMDKVAQGWQKKIVSYIDNNKINLYLERLRYELDVIKKLGFVRYFLIVEDIVRFAKENNILVGYGRGSVAGSLVAYLMGITFVDPIRFGLFFERFLNPDRVSMPDIDLDFEDKRREEIFEYIRNKYGVDKTAKINTFTVMHGKTAFRDVCRVFGVKPLEIDTLSKLIDETLPLDEAIQKDYILTDFCNKNPNIYKHALRLEGVIRAVGVHAAGIVISANNLTDRCVVEYRQETGTKKGVYVTNWDKDVCEKHGLLKIDILGLSSLTIINYALQLIKERHNVDLDVQKISLELNDEKVLNNFSKGLTTGIFQFETGGMQQLLRNINANTFEKIYHATALYRPGSLKSGETKKYIDIINHKERPNYYNNEVIKNILGETYSILVFQEQMMAIFHQIGGFSLAEADMMRKIVGKKLGVDKFNQYKDKFIDGAVKNNINKNIAIQLFEQMSNFADYSFNKAHAVSYTLLSYLAMYLKTYYPIEFFTALLSVDRENKVKLYVRDAVRNNITISMPDINYSDYNFIIKDNVIIPPLTSIKGIGERVASYIIEERKNNGQYIDEDDFIKRVYKRVVHKGVRDLLYKCGALSSIGLVNPNKEERETDYISLISIYDNIPNVELKPQKIDKDILLYKYNQIQVEDNEVIIYPTTSTNPSILVITNVTPSEGVKLDEQNRFRIMWHKSTKYFFDIASYYGFPKRCFYVTTGVKKGYKTKSKFDPSKLVYLPINNNQHLEEYQKFLHEEINMVNPSIIICMSGWHINMLIGKKLKMGDLTGTLEWSPIYKKPVGFCYSPQYCYYNDAVGIIERMFDEINSIII